MNNATLPAKTKANPAAQFRSETTRYATSILSDWVGEDRANEAIGRISVALSAAAASAKNPNDFYACTPGSVASVIAISALTGIMVGSGPTALAYAIPRRPRKGETPQLTYQLSHRGMNALAGRADRIMIPIPISTSDEIMIDDSGDVKILSRDFDNPPTSEEDLRGIVLVVKVASTGSILMRQWVPKKLINERRAVSDSYQYAESNDWAKKSDPWHKWYIEQAMKTAMHYAISRGWCVIDDTASARAFAADSAADLSPIEMPRIQGSRTDQVSALLGAGETSSAEEQPPTEEVSEFAPRDDESTEAYMHRVKTAISVAGSVDALNDIVSATGSYAGGDFMSDEQYGKIAEAANQRVKQLEEAKAKGQLV